MRKFFQALATLIILFVGYILFNTFSSRSQQMEFVPIPHVPIDNMAIERFQEALRIKTISHENAALFDSSAFRQFNLFLAYNYQGIDSALSHQYFNEFSHLYKWTGRNEKLKPVLLMGHLDVVPIASPEKWAVPPFAGTLKDNFIWGRGTIDDKFTVIGILEAAEMLIKEGFQPERTLYFSFGHDEEVGGNFGAIPIATFFEEQGIEAELILDEGYAITQGLVPGIEDDVAMIGIAEKGSTTIVLEVNMKGGHSSQPAKETAIDLMSSAISKLKANQMAPEFTIPMQGFMDQLGPEMSFINKMAFANRGIFKPIISSTYEKASGSGNALIRTTTAPTIFEAGIKENVIPTYAKAVVNFRIIPGQTKDDVMEHVLKTIDDERISAKFQGFSSNPSPVSAQDGPSYGLINQTIKEIFPNALTAPNLVLGATDARHFTAVSKNIYRFVPYHINKSNIDSFHGINERISVEDYKDAIRFYRQLMLNTDALD